MVLLTDGTHIKNIGLETHSLVIEQDGRHVPRALPVVVATSHTSEEQLRAWVTQFEGLTNLWNRSPIGRVRPLSVEFLVDKIKGMMSDHANDQKCLAQLWEAYKNTVDRASRGETSVKMMSDAERTELGIRIMDWCITEAGGYDKWDERKRQCTKFAINVRHPSTDFREGNNRLDEAEYVESRQASEERGRTEQEIRRGNEDDGFH